MKVYLLVLNFAIDGTPDCSIATFATKAAAQKKMREEFEEYKKDYLNTYDESDIAIEEPDEHGACIYLEGDYNEKHDEWSIVESEVQGVEEFPVAVIMRDDLEFKGFKAKDLNNDTMEVIASKMGDYMLDDIGYWDALEASCEWHGIERKDEEEEQ